MVDLSNKYFQTRNDLESEKLLRVAVAQGYKLPAGLKALVTHRIFKFTGFPYKTVSFPDKVNIEIYNEYVDIFGDEEQELKEILNRSAKFYREHGYAVLRIYADENESDYSASAFAKTHDGGNVKTQVQLPKPRKVTLEEIEQRFGYPVEIVS